jgi:Ca-activated chloride channel family protein
MHPLSVSFATVQPVIAILAAALSIASSSIALTRIIADRRSNPAEPQTPRRSRALRPQMLIILVIAGAASTGLVSARGSIGCENLVVASSKEKFSMLQDLAATFGQDPQWISDAGGSCMSVTVVQVNSGDAEHYLETDWANQTQPRPDVWLPASSAWVNLLLYKVPDEAKVIPTKSPSLFQSPLVFAMPKPMADLLGYPGKPVSWQKIIQLANSQGWATEGQPSWGPLKLGKTNPTVSSSGLNSLIGMYHAIGADGSPGAVDSVTATNFAKGIESSVAHYGETADDFLADVYAADTNGQVSSYVSAVAIEEQEVIQYDAGNKTFENHTLPATKLIPVAPTGTFGGTPYDDHPYVILKSSRRPAAAARFYNFLTKQQAVFDQNYFRQKSAPGPALDARLTALGLAGVAPPTPVAAPSGGVIAAEIRAWEAIRKPAKILILVHRTGDPKQTSSAVAELTRTISDLGSQDQFAVQSFPAARGSTCPAVGSKTAAVASLASISIPSQKAIPSDGSLFGVLGAALGCSRASYDPKAINAILLVDMSPGFNPTTDTFVLPLLHDQCPTTPNQTCANFIHVFTIGSSDAYGQLDKGMIAIANNGQGVAYGLGGSFHFLRHLVSDF